MGVSTELVPIRRTPQTFGSGIAVSEPVLKRNGPAVDLNSRAPSRVVHT